MTIHVALDSPLGLSWVRVPLWNVEQIKIPASLKPQNFHKEQRDNAQKKAFVTVTPDNARIGLCFVHWRGRLLGSVNPAASKATGARPSALDVNITPETEPEIRHKMVYAEDS